MATWIPDGFHRLGNNGPRCHNPTSILSSSCIRALDLDAACGTSRWVPPAAGRDGGRQPSAARRARCAERRAASKPAGGRRELRAERVPWGPCRPPRQQVINVRCGPREVPPASGRVGRRRSSRLMSWAPYRPPHLQVIAASCRPVIAAAGRAQSTERDAASAPAGDRRQLRAAGERRCLLRSMGRAGTDNAPSAAPPVAPSRGGCRRSPYSMPSAWMPPASLASSRRSVALISLTTRKAISIRERQSRDEDRPHPREGPLVRARRSCVSLSMSPGV